MPIVRVEMWEGRSLDQKRRLVRALTDVLSEIGDCDPSSVRIVITEHSKENWAIGGVRLTSRAAWASAAERHVQHVVQALGQHDAHLGAQFVRDVGE